MKSRFQCPAQVMVNQAVLMSPLVGSPGRVGKGCCLKKFRGGFDQGYGRAGMLVGYLIVWG